MYIATRHARLEAREAGFLVYNILKKLNISWTFLNKKIGNITEIEQSSLED
jgi:hypothetical protein